MPKTNTKITGFISKLILVAITGRPMTNVSIFPKRTESDGESSFCFRNSKVRAAKLIPENMAKIFPVKPSRVSSSIKNNASPVNRIAIVTQSTIVDFSPRNIYQKRAT